VSLDGGSYREMDPSHPATVQSPAQELSRPGSRIRPWERRRHSTQLNLLPVYRAGVGLGADAEGYVLSVNAAFNGAADSATSRSETAGRRFQLSCQRTTVLNQRVKRIARNC
jgi:hypothetical protein